MTKPEMGKLSVFYQRRKKEITVVGYLFMIGACLLFLLDPGVDSEADRQKARQKALARMKFTPYSYFKPRPKGETLNKVIDLPFVSRDHRCEDIFEKSGYKFAYPDTYEDHADAFKAALIMNDLVSEGVATEFSWLLMSMGSLPFARTACETHFHSGHNAFHLLASQDDLVVHSFGPDMKNYTQDLADFMAIEFPDRFFLHKGDPLVTITSFIKNQGNKTKCDIVFVESTQDATLIKQELELFHKVAHPVENIVIINTHQTYGRKDVVEIWDKMIADKKIYENFRCTFPKEDPDMPLPRNQQGFLMGSYSQRSNSSKLV